MDTVRVLRVVEYIGPRDWVENVVSKSIQGEKVLGRGKVIKAATVGNYPEILEFAEPTTENEEKYLCHFSK